jgi:hypothetical protein
MKFHGFRFGNMKVAQADPDSPKLIAVEMSFGFKAADVPAVQVLAATVQIPHDNDKTVTAPQEEAFAAARRLLEAAAAMLRDKTPEELAAETERNRAVVVN